MSFYLAVLARADAMRIIAQYLHTAVRAYGNFATVITILWWFSLGSIVTLFGSPDRVPAP